MRHTTLVAIVLCISCSPVENSSTHSSTKESQNIEVKFATGFTISTTSQGFDIIVRNPQDTTQILGEYSLDTSDSAEINVPVQSTVLNSTTFGAFFDRLGGLDVVKGMTYSNSVMSPRVKERIDSGRIQEIISGDGVDFERILEINPDVVFSYSYGETDFSRYEELGIPIVLLMDYKESHPLGRAEWIKVVGCFLGKFEEAESVFNTVMNNYEEVRQQATLHSTLPSAFTGSRYGDFWYAPGKDSYIAQFIRDAGATYAFEHVDGQASAELDFEQALVDISATDYWGLVTSTEGEFTKANILEMNQLYEKLKAYQEDHIFVCNTQEKDYFGDAIMEPDLILADLYKIFHPQSDQDSIYHYFKPIR